MLTSILNFMNRLIENKNIERIIRQLDYVENEIELYKYQISQPDFERLSKKDRIAARIHFINCLHNKVQIEKRLNEAYYL